MPESPAPPPRRVSAILLAGGQGMRAGFARPKQLEMLGGKPVLRWSLDALAGHNGVSGGVLVANHDVMAAASPLPEGWISAVPGAERQQSGSMSNHGLSVAQARFAKAARRG